MSVYTVRDSQQSDQCLHYLPFSVWSSLHYLPFSVIWSGSTLFALVSKQYCQCLHWLPFSAVWSGSTLSAFLSSLIKVKYYTVVLRNSLNRFYTICHSQQSDQGLHCLPFSAVWLGSILFAILSSLIKVMVYTVILRNSLIKIYTICHSNQSDQGFHCLSFSAVLSGSTLFAILSSLIRVYTICHSQQSDQVLDCLPSQQSGHGLHYLPFLVR